GRGFVGWVQPPIRPGVVVGCTHPTLKIVTHLAPRSHDFFPFPARLAPRIGVPTMSGQLRRLPIYLLLDCSESMAGEAIADLERGVETMVTVLRGDPQALESAYVSVITFARDARQVLPLTEILSFQCP